MRTAGIKTSNDLIGKQVRIIYEGNDDMRCVVDVMEEGGILVHYYTEGDDSNSVCDKDDDEAVRTVTYIPWSSLHSIDYRDDEEYP